MITNYQIPISATLARRLAEAADGFRNINQVFFVAQYEAPYFIKEFYDVTSAENFFSDQGFTESEYGIFGPYKTLDILNEDMYRGVEDIASIDLTIHFNNGDVQNETINGNIDAIFLNLSAHDKFVFPYYCHLYGIDTVKKMRDDLIKKYKEDKIIPMTLSTRLPEPTGHGQQSGK